MKKIAVVAMCLLVLSTTMVSCFRKSKLEMMVKAMNLECPKEFGNGMTGESVTHENGVVTMEIVADGPAVILVENEAYADLLKTSLLIGFAAQSTEEGSFLNVLVEEKAALKLVLSAKDKDDKISIDISAEELAKVEKEGVRFTPMQLLQNWIIAMNRALPENLGNGMSVVKYEIDGEFFVETVSVSDKKAMKELLSMQKEMKGIMKDNVLPNPGMQKLFKICKDAGKGYARHFVSEDGSEKVVIEFAPSELP